MLGTTAERVVLVGDSAGVNERASERFYNSPPSPCEGARCVGGLYLTYGEVCVPGDTRGRTGQPGGGGGSAGGVSVHTGRAESTLG